MLPPSRLLGCVLLVAGCWRPHAPEAPDTPVFTCEDACGRARELGCSWGAPTDEGATCEAVCANMQQGILEWDLACRTTADSCEAVEACEGDTP